MSKPTARAYDNMTKSLQQPIPVQDNTATAAPARTPRATVSRRGTKIIAGHFPESFHQNLRIVGAEEKLTTQQILEEALNDWLIKKGKAKFILK